MTNKECAEYLRAGSIELSVYFPPPGFADHPNAVIRGRWEQQGNEHGLEDVVDLENGSLLTDLGPSLCRLVQAIKRSRG